MELQLYLDILKRRALVIAIVTAMAVLVVTAAGMFIRPVYTAKSTVRILLDVGIADFNLREDYNTRLLNTYSQFLKSGPVLEQAIGRISARNLTVNDLQGRVEAQVVPNTEFINIFVRDSDPAIARDLANALATLMIEHAQDLYIGSSRNLRQIIDEQLADIETQLEQDRQQLAVSMARGMPDAEVEAIKSKIQFAEDAYNRLQDRYEEARLNQSLRANSIILIEPAALPSSPSNALGVRDVALGLLMGLFGGIGLALILENLDTHLYSPQQLEHMTSLPVLGAVPKGWLHKQGQGNGSETGRNGSLNSEAYRLLSINLQALRENTALRTVLVTSAMPREGKSTVAANLAWVLAERGQTVFLVDGNLRNPDLEKSFGLDGSFGLSNLLAERTALDGAALGRVLQPSEQSSLFIVGAGSKTANPTLLLASPPMAKLLDYLGTQGQMTLLDAPPVLGAADVSVLVPNVDGIILVVRQSQSDREHVLAAIKQLQASRARVLGFVFLQSEKS